MRTLRFRPEWAVAGLLLVVAGLAPQTRATAATEMTADLEGFSTQYLAPEGTVVPEDWRSQVIQAVHTDEGLVLAAPLEPDTAPAVPAMYVHPKATELARSGSDERAVPLGQTEVLAMGPAGFGRVMTGRSGEGTGDWCETTETAISYIRPHVNLQMLVAFTVPGSAEAATFEGPGFQPNARLLVDQTTAVNSAEIGSRTAGFGYRAAPEPSDEPRTAVVAGLDLGLLPTFLAQMGVGVSVVAQRGTESGDVRLAVVGTTELPVDWIPPERPRQHPIGLAVDPLNQQEAFGFAYTSATVSGGRVPGEFITPGGDDDDPTPIEPVPVPEPASMALMAAGLASLVASLRKRH